MRSVTAAAPPTCTCGAGDPGERAALTAGTTVGPDRVDGRRRAAGSDCSTGTGSAQHVHGAVGRGRRPAAVGAGDPRRCRERGPNAGSQRGSHAAGGGGRGPDDDVDRGAVLREGRGEPVVGVDGGEAAAAATRRRAARAHPERRQRRAPAATQPAASVHTSGRRVDRARRAGPRRSRCEPRRAARAPRERQPQRLDPVAEHRAAAPAARSRRRARRPPTTSMAPIASEVNMPPATSIPLIATTTVMPEMSDRAAGGRAGGRDRLAHRAPAARSSRERRMHEQRVVDADREPDEQHQGLGVLVDRGDAAGGPARSARARSTTAPIPSSTGTPAATTAPNATSSTPRVTGRLMQLGPPEVARRAACRPRRRSSRGRPGRPAAPGAPRRTARSPRASGPTASRRASRRPASAPSRPLHRVEADRRATSVRPSGASDRAPRRRRRRRPRCRRRAARGRAARDVGGVAGARPRVRHHDVLGRPVTEVGAGAIFAAAAESPTSWSVGVVGRQAAAQQDDRAGEHEQGGEQGAPAVLGAPAGDTARAPAVERRAPGARWGRERGAVVGAAVGRGSGMIVVMASTWPRGGPRALVPPAEPGRGTAPPPVGGWPPGESAGQHRPARRSRSLRLSS